MDSRTKEVKRKSIVVKYALIAVGEAASLKGYNAAAYECQM